jgi:hypothetical protein
MTSMRIPVGVATVLVGLMVLAPAPASAACFESGVGCTNDHTISYSALRRLSCDALWTVRNTIYYENGYCFHTARGMAAFGNQGCAYDDAGMVPLNNFERNNIGRIVTVEKQKGCR